MSASRCFSFSSPMMRAGGRTDKKARKIEPLNHGS
jgi:hypothetical protein